MKNTENGKVLMRKEDFEVMRKSIEWGSRQEIQVDGTNIILSMYHGSFDGKEGQEVGKHYSMFHILDEEGSIKNNLCTLANLDYIEIDKEAETVIMSDGTIKIIIDNDGSFEEYWEDNGGFVGVEECEICGSHVTSYDERPSDIPLCSLCSEEYDYNYETGKLEMIN